MKKRYQPVKWCVLALVGVGCYGDPDGDDPSAADLAEAVFPGDCTPGFFGYECRKHADYTACLQSLYAGQVLYCAETGDRESLAMRGTLSYVTSQLQSLGCTKIDGKVDEFRCSDSRGHDKCLAYLRGHVVRQCALSDDTTRTARYASSSEVAAELNFNGCFSNPTLVGGWVCDSRSSVDLCETYRRGRATTSCVMHFPQVDFTDDPWRFESSPATGQYWVSVNPSIKITRYKRGDISDPSSETNGYVYMDAVKPVAPTNPACTPGCGWTCEPECRTAWFFTEDVGLYDGLYAFYVTPGTSCSGTTTWGDHKIVFEMSEREAAYDACQRSAWARTLTTWSHTALISIKRKISAMWNMTYRDIDVRPNGCSYEDTGQILARYRTFELPVVVTCRE